MAEELTEHVLHDVTDGIATITINRPERRNALTYAMLDAIRQATYADGADPAVKAPGSAWSWPPSAASGSPPRGPGSPGSSSNAA